MPTTKRAPSAERRLFGARLRAERRRQSLTLEDVGDRADIAWNYVAQVERGERNIGIDNMAALAHALGLDLATLLQTPEEHAEPPSG
ncbi:helix-turn-helix transcriptional regulator [Deinococcus sp. KSM4-11]|uniref:helix-turn-helix domain-containing protein n=1 Tax=Deinococcus sp. KSM4-11 TaxID=2568654 RepID=UPI0010A44D4D|nr:helix-turn-helix transcriptional regulator [Deinococcus sp. KSM4-11]THF87125.1 helix-turn-helix transcriptional regulator [Deinococcus sp. KSM4-11]